MQVVNKACVRGVKMCTARHPRVLSGTQHHRAVSAAARQAMPATQRACSAVRRMDGLVRRVEIHRTRWRSTHRHCHGRHDAKLAPGEHSHDVQTMPEQCEHMHATHAHTASRLPAPSSRVATRRGRSSAWTSLVDFNCASTAISWMWVPRRSVPRRDHDAKRVARSRRRATSSAGGVGEKGRAFTELQIIHGYIRATGERESRD